MKTYLYCIQKGKKTRLLEIDRLTALKIVKKYDAINGAELGTFSSTSFSSAIKTYREYSPYKKVNSEEELISS